MDKKMQNKIDKLSDEAKKEVREKNIIDVLLDEENKEPIVLMNEENKTMSFEQIAVIPFNDKIYCVLKPVDEMAGVEDDEAIVFYVHEEEGKEPLLMVETDEAVAMSVFDEYYNLLDEEEKKNRK